MRRAGGRYGREWISAGKCLEMSMYTFNLTHNMADDGYGNLLVIDIKPAYYYLYPFAGCPHFNGMIKEVI